MGPPEPRDPTECRFPNGDLLGVNDFKHCFCVWMQINRKGKPQRHDVLVKDGRPLSPDPQGVSQLVSALWVLRGLEQHPVRDT